MPLTLSVHAQSDVGKVREVNQDSVLALIRPPTEEEPLAALLAVADGVGGHAAGEVASSIVVDTLKEVLSYYIKRGEEDTTEPLVPAMSEDRQDSVITFFETKLRQAIEKANAAIGKYAVNNPDAAGLASTVTSALIYEELAIVANVGDSRTYLLRDGKFAKLTEDHTYVAELVRGGALEPEAQQDHPKRGLLVRALGREENVDIDVRHFTLRAGDRIVLCSDGLWDVVKDEEAVARVVGLEAQPSDRAQRLIDLANEAGGNDNIGLVLADLDELDQLL
jgi:protein phosphatase